MTPWHHPICVFVTGTKLNMLLSSFIHNLVSMPEKYKKHNFTLCNSVISNQNVPDYGNGKNLFSPSGYTVMVINLWLRTCMQSAMLFNELHKAA